MLKEILNKFVSVIYLVSILMFMISFNFSDNPPPSGWYQQFMPNLGGRSVTDVTFLDSLTGYAITSRVSDTSFILKTSNGGDNWSIIYADSGSYLFRVQFINQNTGFVGMDKNIGFSDANFLKTTNQGASWFYVYGPQSTWARDISVISNDSIYFVCDFEFATGGIYLTTNGGATWEHRGDFGLYNPDRVYFFNRDIGFIGRISNGYRMYRTGNSGANWSLIPNNETFSDMYFADSLTGWKSFGSMKKTTDGGFNWVTQTLPSGGMIQVNAIGSFSDFSRDTIWGNGGYVLYPNNRPGFILNRTTNGGITWLFQVPDTTFFRGASIVEFTDGLHGWAYGNIHTVTGGDDTFYVSVRQLSSLVPREFFLSQNYPNPFNTNSNIKFRTSKKLAHVVIKVFDLTGKLVSELVNQKLTSGEYETSFDAKDLPSGVYFYSLIVDGKMIDTKKSILIK